MSFKSTAPRSCTTTFGWNTAVCCSRGRFPRDLHSTLPSNGLAMQVEDHPREYASFEGVIPEGQYGAGTVMVWDHGEWSPESDDVESSLRKGDLKFTLHGEKAAWFLGACSYARVRQQSGQVVAADQTSRPVRFQRRHSSCRTPLGVEPAIARRHCPRRGRRCRDGIHRRSDKRVAIRQPSGRSKAQEEEAREVMTTVATYSSRSFGAFWGTTDLWRRWRFVEQHRRCCSPQQKDRMDSRAPRRSRGVCGQRRGATDG